METHLAKFSGTQLKEAYEQLSNFYRKERQSIAFSLDSEAKRWAYVAARLPATYQAVARVLQEIDGEEEILSMLDVGAGCGTASIAACEYFPSLAKIRLLEQNKGMIDIGKDHEILKNAHWLNSSMLSPDLEFPAADLTVLSYSINEIPVKNRPELIQKLWEKTNKYLVIVEPGTAESFELIHALRDYFIAQNATIYAPCSHALGCPAFQTKTVCHFSARVQRTALHRYLKEGEKSFEDEKFSYLILSKVGVEKYSGRIVWEPSSRSGFVSFKVCNAQGFETKVFTKKDKGAFQAVKHKEWGDKMP